MPKKNIETTFARWFRATWTKSDEHRTFAEFRLALETKLATATIRRALRGLPIRPRAALALEAASKGQLNAGDLAIGLMRHEDRAA